MKPVVLVAVSVMSIGVVARQPDLVSASPATASPPAPLATSAGVYTGSAAVQTADETGRAIGGPLSAERLALAQRVDGGVGDRFARGVARPAQRADLAVPFDGVLATMHVREGDVVRRGQPIATMDDRVAAAAVAAARVAAERQGPIAFAEEALRLEETRLTRLREADAATPFELEEAEIRVAQSRAKLTTAIEDRDQAQRTLDLEQARFEQHVIRATFDGRIARTHARPGESLDRREPIATIANLDRLEVEINVPLDVYESIRVGQWYELLAGAPVAAPIAARLRTAEPYLDAATRTVRCVFEIPNDDDRMPAGFALAFDPDRLTPLPDPAAAATATDGPSRD